MLPQFNEMLFGGDSTKSVNKDQVLAGIISLKNQELAISKVEANGMVQSCRKHKLNNWVRQEEGVKAQPGEHRRGDAFMAENGAERGVAPTLPSGLQYEVIRAIVAPCPPNRPCEGAYHGTLIDGCFRSSVDVANLPPLV